MMGASLFLLRFCCETNSSCIPQNYRRHRCYSHRFPSQQTAPRHDGNSHQRANHHERVSDREGEDAAEDRTIVDVVYSPSFYT